MWVLVQGAERLLAQTQPGSRRKDEPQPPPTSPGGTNDLETALSPDISPEHRRYLLYLYSRLNRPDMVEALAQRILLDTPDDKQTLQLLASTYLEQKNAEKTMAIAERLQARFPDDDETRYYLGAAYLLAERYEDANAVFRTLKTERFQNRRYPYETDLASSALMAGDWHQAMLAYQEVLQDPMLSEELRLATRRVLDEIYRKHLPQITGESRAYLLSSGVLLRSLVEYRQHLTPKIQGFMRWVRRDVHLSAESGLREQWQDDNDGIAGVDIFFNRRWQGTAWAGGTHSGPLGGVGIVRTWGPQRDLRLEFRGHEPASDSLAFESLNGRQNRLVLEGNYLWNRDWFSSFQVYGREATVGTEHFGWGYAVMGTMERVILHDRPDLRVGYRGTWFAFSRDEDDLDVIDPLAVPGSVTGMRSDILKGMILNWSHRHGLFLGVEHALTSALSLHGYAGSDYVFELSSMEHYALGGFSFFPRKSFEIRGEGGYATSASTSDVDSDQWQVGLTLKYYF